MKIIHSHPDTLSPELRRQRLDDLHRACLAALQNSGICGTRRPSPQER